jgi:anti-anti-sigma regulatory factor
MSDGPNACRNSSVTVEKKDDAYVMSIIGDFVGSTTPLVHECCKKTQRDRDIKKIILDFSRAGRVDTTAFACIISFIKANLGTATEIVVTNLRDPEKNLLQMLKVEKIIREV